MNIYAILIICMSLYLIYKHRNNKVLFLVFLFIFYCNYSICVGEYSLPNLHLPYFEELRFFSVNYYNQGIIVLFLFMLFFSLFFKDRSRDNNFKLQTKSNTFIFLLLILLLIYIFLFCFNREQSTNYTVKITPLYEYSLIIFLFAIQYSDTKIKKIILCILSFFYILQDLIWGGRITSVQLILLFAFTIFYKFLTKKRIIFFFIIGIFCMSSVGFYRNSYSIEKGFFSNIVNYLQNNLFVLDTAASSYGASVIQLYVVQFITISERIASFFNYFFYIFAGNIFSVSDLLGKDTITHVPNFIGLYYAHSGGGIFPFYFYFWFGWIGTVIAGILMAKYITFFTKQISELGKIMFITILIYTPRWFLYSPINAFRPLLFVLIIYGGLKLLMMLLHACFGKHEKSMVIS